MLKLTNDSGPLAQIWLASNMTNIPRGSVLQTSISESAKEIAEVAGCDSPEDTVDINGGKYVTLRTSGELLQGIVQVYAKQAGFLLGDIKDILTKISSLFKMSSRVGITINKSNTITRIESIILEDTVTEKEVLFTPSLDFLFQSNSPITESNGDNRRHIRGVTTGSAAVWDTSLEIGRQYDLNNNEYSGNNSILDLNFEIEEGPLAIGDEGTRTTGAGEISSIGAGHVLSHNDDDFPIDDEFTNNWNLGIEGEEMKDSSIEVGRRAESSVLEEEHTEFGFDLGLDKEHMQVEDDEDEDLEIQPITSTQSRVRNSHNKNPALTNTTRIIVDDERVLSKKELHTIVTNSEPTQNHNIRMSRNHLTKKRTWDEIDRDMSYLASTIVNGLLRYRNIKKPRIENEENIMGEIQPLDLQEETFNNFEMINDNFQNMDDNNLPAEYDNEIHENAPYNDQDIPDGDINTRILDDLSLSTESSKLAHLTDQVKLTSGELATKNIVDLANTLREEFAESEVTFSALLSRQHKGINEDNTADTSDATIPSRKDASKCFFDILTLATADCITLEQSEPFEDISLTLKSSLYNKFIPA
ncbi:similar to Saccharomyces cerevisiae YDL003W MCD1 Essential subunit of the cohesin complex required for sister chromatid cohesion in mitosis and meiosis [Maudiozyma saulgeensis]|uniref:Similar to Saccharomyces cerevisiae YDL003W MCD1 Essential subunit of the cohesin complex required for sister chromatid cohesion in mitosis and meiosis n=1 Tax=Maudiozyma saulgeensis TaxID=1789683 RepID=A0A1X7R3P4_9SACH|nr:similar to Saccharomyces cerevisiae YDL003W MCD1 Essential subunit of the cohesin complex required for sister chromatid cohesion in mitosis and meiosis [Kazachstania saulgeensis]